MAEVHKVNPTIVGVGPEIAGTSGHATEYMMHFLDPANHKGYQGSSPLPSSETCALFEPATARHLILCPVLLS